MLVHGVARYSGYSVESVLAGTCTVRSSEPPVNHFRTWHTRHRTLLRNRTAFLNISGQLVQRSLITLTNSPGTGFSNESAVEEEFVRIPAFDNVPLKKIAVALVLR